MTAVRPNALKYPLLLPGNDPTPRVVTGALGDTDRATVQRCMLLLNGVTPLAESNAAPRPTSVDLAYAQACLIVLSSIEATSAA